MALQGRAQNPELQQRLAEVKPALAKNKQLAQWTKQHIISLKGEERKEELFQVRLGPDGKPQKTHLDPAAMSDECNLAACPISTLVIDGVSKQLSVALTNTNYQKL